MSLLSIQFPLTEPVIILAIILLILLIGPVFFERIRIPAIVGLLLSGTLIGPHGFNLVSSDLEFSLLGTMGLLYLMFLAGLEIDLIDFMENRARSIFVGLSSFVIPFVLGYFVCTQLLGISVHSSLLVGAMLASHTLISYPILGRLGIINKPIVTITVGATIIADILALVAMEIIINVAEEGFAIDSILLLALSFVVFFLLIFVGMPRISKPFLIRYEGDMGVQYIFVLVLLFMSGMVAHLLKIEPIIGAFFSGLVLNRQISNSSTLYKRIEFIGNNLFIPFFLISIGMLANFRVYVQDPGQIYLVVVLIVVALLGKYLAAIFSKVVLRLNRHEGNLIFGLSASRAASAVAIILIGFNLGIVSESVLNSTVILILVTCIVSSYVTRGAGKKVLLKGIESLHAEPGIKQKFLVPVANPANMKHLLEFSVLIKDSDNEVPVYPLTVFTERPQVRDEIHDSQAELNKVIGELESEVPFETSSRIDNNVTNGIVRAAEELVATTIIIGWNNHKIAFHTLFGNILDNLLKKTNRMVVVLKTPSEFREVKRISVFCPANAHYEHGFSLWLDTLIILSQKLQLKLKIKCESMLTQNAVREYSEKNKASKYFEIEEDFTESMFQQTVKNTAADLLIFVHSRKKTISYHRKHEAFMNDYIHKCDKNNIIVMYPEQ